MGSKWERLGKLGALTTRVGGSYVGQAVTGLFQGEAARGESLRRVHLENAARIAGQLGQLKGVAMKVGQQLAQFADVQGIPEEARALLGSLHDRVEPVPFDVVRARVEAELDAAIEVRFRRFDPAPLGTASLGQAHAAELPDGTPVVVKVLHAGVEDTVGSDLAAARAMLHAGRFVRRPREEVEAIFAELGARIAEELDYTREADNLEAFRAFFAGDPDLVVPAVHRGWSTRRVLTMERLPGRPASVFAATATEAARQRAGVTVVRGFLRMLYGFRAIHADPHPGNYLFTPDGRVGLLDFGCVRRFPLPWIVDYGGCGLATRRDDKAACMRHARAMGALVDAGASDEDVLWDLCRAIGAPFTGGDFTLGGPEDVVQERVAALMPHVILARGVRSPPELVYLHRGLAGAYHLARGFSARHDWGAMFEGLYLGAVADLARGEGDRGATVP
jgi:predicted unusual protein kinase regulating ubiquinone biosynthesis (AarF/ABC1/UbiB family)